MNTISTTASTEELAKRMAHFEAQCRERGLRVTKQRQEIFRTVAQSCEHPCAEKVYQAVRQTMPNVSLDTVYRTLSSLEEMDLLIRVGLSPKERFDGDLHPHAHFVCTQCGEVYDIFPEDGATFPTLPGAEKIGEIKYTNLQFRGICNKCRGHR